MATTPNLSLELDTPGVTPGLTEANHAESNKTTLDNHDHTSGKGTRVPTLGINVNADLSFNSYAATSLRMSRYVNLGAEPTAGDDVRAVYVYDNNLWFIRHDGTKVKITNGGVLNASALNADTYIQQAVSTNITINPAATYTQLLVDSSVGALTITLSAASSFTAGRYFIITDVGNGANTITIAPDTVAPDTINGITGNRVFKMKYGEVKLTRIATTKWSLAGSVSHVVNGTEGTGAVMQITTPGAANWGAIDLTGATTAITGLLPPVNMTEAAAGTKGIVQLTNDLGGTSGAPTVGSITGLAGTVLFRSTVANLKFQNAAAGVGAAIAIGGSDAATGDGGTIQIEGGKASASGNAAGGVYLGVKSSTSTTTQMVSALGFTDTRRVLALVGNPSATDVPAGDKLLYIGNAVTAPSTNPALEVPVSGFLMWSNSGKPSWKFASGERFDFGTWGSGSGIGSLAGVWNITINGVAYKIPIYN